MANEPQILFVDDEENIRLTLSMMLKNEGFKVTTAATVADALRLMSEHKFDVLISDMNIQRAGDGFAVVSAMRSTQPGAVRLILTGYPAIDTALQALREEVDDYLIKPTEVEQIVAKIHERLKTTSNRKQIGQKRLSEIIQREQEYITDKWLALAKLDADLGKIPLSDAERKYHLPQLLSSTVALLEHKSLSPEHNSAAIRHGETRFQQGYLAVWLLRETKLLEEALAACIQRHLLEIQISTLIPDMVATFGAIHDLLEQSMLAFLAQNPRRKLRKR
jgi:ActR/RegA family two-component response regulator